MVEPDFTPMPVYHALKEQTQQPVSLYPGWYQADHWGITYQGNWQTQAHPEATFGTAFQATQAGDQLEFMAVGRQVTLDFVGDTGRIRLGVDNDPPREVTLEAGPAEIPVAEALFARPHRITVKVIEAPVFLNAVIVK
jgi:hypothetical protein